MKKTLGILLFATAAIAGDIVITSEPKKEEPIKKFTMMVITRKYENNSILTVDNMYHQVEYTSPDDTWVYDVELFENQTDMLAWLDKYYGNTQEGVTYCCGGEIVGAYRLDDNAKINLISKKIRHPEKRVEIHREWVEKRWSVVE